MYGVCIPREKRILFGVASVRVLVSLSVCVSVYLHKTEKILIYVTWFDVTVSHYRSD